LIQQDWASVPPLEVWRRPIGPGWSSFAVRAGLVYTQEQRGEQEVVTAYSLANGAPVWIHNENVRFWESNAGAGPRATPSVSADGRTVYAMGATGILVALDSRIGAKRWSRNVAAETGAKVPEWGIAASPLVLDDAVIVAASSHLAAYDAATGKMKWHSAAGGVSYASPHLLTLDGVQQVVLLTGPGATSVNPADGKVLWKHEWTPGAPMLQPTATPDGTGILITTVGSGGGIGTRNIAVSRKSGAWATEERWTSTGLKPYFDDLVIHKGHAYGFDGTILACIDLQDGKRKWKGGRFGHGQLILLPEQDLLVVLSEDGELGLVSATPDAFKELGTRVRAMEGKTWNHPVLAGGNMLLARNGEEMVAFRLPVVAASASGDAAVR
jgi:outer membrane protein assembly factor BamB